MTSGQLITISIYWVFFQVGWFSGGLLSNSIKDCDVWISLSL